MIGKLKWYDGVKGYGFIHSDESKADIFFHHSSLLLGKKDMKKLKTMEGVTLEFEIMTSARGPAAVNVRFAPGGAIA